MAVNDAPLVIVPLALQKVAEDEHLTIPGIQMLDVASAGMLEVTIQVEHSALSLMEVNNNIVPGSLLTLSSLA